ncbi:MAG: hypothetical protein WBC71_01250 [Salaquimonas sp.]
MIRPVSEIEYPPSDALLAKASMIARMESLKTSGDALMNVISQRIGAEKAEEFKIVEELTAEQERLIANMKQLVVA